VAAVPAVRDKRLHDEVKQRALYDGAESGHLDALPDNTGIDGMATDPDSQASHLAVPGPTHRGLNDPLTQAKFMHVTAPVRCVVRAM